MKWDLLLLVVVLLLSMLPSAGVFRWSFRWLPLIHVTLALCAAEALRVRPAISPGLIALVLLSLVAVPMLALGFNGTHSFPLTWILLCLAALWAALEFFLRESKIIPWLPPAVTFIALLATYLCIPPNCGVPKFNLAQELVQPAPLDTRRLYLSIYSPAEFAYRIEARRGPVGQIVRPGSLSMWAGLHFINGYSPIRPAGLAREFQFAIHGEIDPDIGQHLLRHEAGQGGALEELGVDGIVVAQEVAADPEPRSDWQLVFSNEEGRVFHRRDPSVAAVRSRTWVDSRPDEEFTEAAISKIEESRNQVQLEIDVPNGAQSALLSFSRPFFRGYKARVGETKLQVNSYRGLIPIIEVPPGSHGRLVLSYCPGWLVYGGAVAIGCALFIIAGAIAAIRQRG